MRYLIGVISMLLPTTLISAGTPDIADIIQRVNPQLTRQRAQMYAGTIRQYSNAFEIDAKLVAAVIAVESAFNENAVGSSHGEIGLMQLRPEFHMLNIKNIKNRRKALFNVDHNIGTGVRYIAGLKEVFKAQYRDKRYIEHYNVGPNRKPKTFKYTNKVMRMYRLFGGKA